MIAFVKGKIYAVQEDSLTLELGGVGLAVLAPVRSMRPQPVIGEEIMLHTHLLPREDAWLLFGFLEEQQLALFRQLLAVSGIGAKTALAIMNHLSGEGIIRALADGDYNPFCKVPGVGKKTAQRIIVDLKDKFKMGESADIAFLSEGTAAAPELYNDLLAALEQLGYQGAEARALMLAARKNLGEGASSGQLLQEALKQAARN